MAWLMFSFRLSAKGSGYPWITVVVVLIKFIQATIVVNKYEILSSPISTIFKLAFLGAYSMIAAQARSPIRQPFQPLLPYWRRPSNTITPMTITQQAAQMASKNMSRMGRFL